MNDVNEVCYLKLFIITINHSTFIINTNVFKQSTYTIQITAKVVYTTQIIMVSEFDYSYSKQTGRQI